MSEGVLTNHLNHYIIPIKYCIDGGHHIPALVLIYSGIEHYSWISYRHPKESARKSDFIRWSEEFMECKKRLGVSGNDLYAARCGILHTHTANFDIVRNKGSVKIYYVHGKRNADDINAYIKSIGRAEKFLRIEELFESFLHGLNHLGMKASDDSRFTDHIFSHSGEMFANYEYLPGFPRKTSQ